MGWHRRLCPCSHFATVLDAERRNKADLGHPTTSSNLIFTGGGAPSEKKRFKRKPKICLGNKGIYPDVRQIVLSEKLFGISQLLYHRLT
jgi:hypothetical protein